MQCCYSKRDFKNFQVKISEDVAWLDNWEILRVYATGVSSWKLSQRDITAPIIDLIIDPWIFNFMHVFLIFLKDVT